MAFTPGNIGDADSVVIKVKVDAKDAVDGMKRMESITTDKFGVMTKRVKVFDEALNRSVTTVTKHNEKIVDQLSDFVRKHKDAMAGIAVVVTGIKKAFDLALFAAKKSSDEGSRAFMQAYDKMGKAIEEFKVTLGRVLMPALTAVANTLTSLIRIIDDIADAVRRIPGFDDGAGVKARGDAAKLARKERFERLDKEHAESWRKAQLQRQQEGWRLGSPYQSLSRMRSPWSGVGDGSGGGGGGGGGGGPQAPLSGGSDVFGGLSADVAYQKMLDQIQLDAAMGGTVGREAGKAASQSLDARAGSVKVSSIASVGMSLRELNEQVAQMQQYTKGQDFLTSIFGPIETFSLYARGFQLLESATQAAFSAWIDGTMSVKEALADFLKSQIRSLALEFAAQAVRHAAYAVGNVAFAIATENPRYWAAAATHGKAALAFSAGAAVFGASARAIGPVGGVGAAVGGGSSVAGIGGGSNNGGDRNVTVIIGDSLDDDPPRVRRHRLSKAIRKGMGATSSGTFYS